MSNQNKVRKKCTVCDRTQVVALNETVCRFTSIARKEDCPGQLELHAADREDAVSNLVAIVREIHARHRFLETDLLEAALEDLSCWDSAAETPQQMGWVGQDGLP